MPEPIHDGILTSIVVPGIVCLAFSVELELKAMLLTLHLLPLKPEHNLFKLFNRLPDYVQADVLQLCSARQPSFCKSLKEVSESFVTWRYSYEHGLLEVNLAFLQDLSKACEAEYVKLCNHIE